MRTVFTLLIVAILSLNGFAASLPTPIITFKFDKLEYLLTDYAVIWQTKDDDGIVTEWIEHVLYYIETPDSYLYYTKEHRFTVPKHLLWMDVKEIGSTSLAGKTYFVKR
jgi:hypothetical protein